jgi:hypothetical protein
MPSTGTRSGTAGQDDAFRPHLAERAFGVLERHDLAIDLLLAHAPRDQLRDLRAEIDDENLVVGLRILLGHDGFGGGHLMRNAAAC